MALIWKTINRIVLETVDAALAECDFADKETFYQFLEVAYSLKPEDFADNFEQVHEALQRLYGANHYRIEQMMIRILHERSRQGIYPRDFEIVVFGRMVNVFSAEMQANMDERREIAEVIEHSKQLQKQVNEAQAKLKDAERLLLFHPEI